VTNKSVRNNTEQANPAVSKSSLNGLDALPLHVQQLLRSCPEEGKGVHSWIFRTAATLHKQGIDPEEIRTLLEQHSGRVDDREIDQAIENSDPERQTELSPRDSADRRHRYHLTRATRDYAEMLRLARIGPSLSQLEHMSGVPLGEQNRPNATQIVDRLFPGDPLLCCGASKHTFETKKKSEWGNALDRLEFIVPNPMSKKRGITQAGKSSAHCKDNTGPRRYLVVESDIVIPKSGSFGTTAEKEFFSAIEAGEFSIFDAAAALHWKLSSILSLDAVVHSGNKSVHGWFYCNGLTDDELVKFMGYAVRLGADPTTWNSMQFVRMPEGLRKPKQQAGFGAHAPIRQRIYFLNNNNV
jgi:hypothetical protein